MIIRLTRDSVAMSDDIDAPHSFEFVVADDTSVPVIIETVFRSNYLASIAGGKATWSAVSNIPLAILAQQWHSPKVCFPVPPLAELDFVDNILALHFRYYTQQDPNVVYD